MRALWRRARWRARWRFSHAPWQLTYRGHMRIAVPRDGLGAQLFYAGFSEPDVEEFCLQFLKPGMVFFDVGAHVGKYTLLCAPAVGPEGLVHAFEPNPDVFPLLELNIERNGLRNAHANRCAVSDEDGVCDFEVCAESSVSSLAGERRRPAPPRPSRIVTVRTVRLDTWCARNGPRPHLVKVDAEGAELLVFQGATGLFGLPAAQSPVWIFEHEPANFARFGYEPARLFEFLRSRGYRAWSCEGGRVAPLDQSASSTIPVNLLAAREGLWLPSLL